MVALLGEPASMADKREPYQRLKEARSEHFDSAADAARSMNIAPSSYAAHENGQNRFTSEQAIQYGKKFGVNPVWLLFGDDFAPKILELTRTRSSGEDLPGDRGSDDDQMTVSEVGGARGVPKGSLVEIEAGGGAGMGGGGVTAIIEGAGAAGAFTFAGEQVAGLWQLPDHALRAFDIGLGKTIVMKTKGDSMHPTIADGDFVLIDTSHRWPSPPGIYALADSYGEIIIKRLEVISRPADEVQQVEIKSDNPRYETRVWNGEDVRVIGRVILRVGKPV